MLKTILHWGDLDLKEPVKSNFFEALRRLIGIFFAVVIGFGFQQYSVDPSLPKYIHGVALAVICLSWWGYYWGITCGPKELNVWSIIIDCFLLVNYWLLLNLHEYNNYLYPSMFLLYTIWEGIRFFTNDNSSDKALLRNAALCNFFFFITFVYIFSYINIAEKEGLVFDEIYIAATIIITHFIYRYTIYKIYQNSSNITKHIDRSDEIVLVKNAIKASENAHTPITNYHVGAAILASNGEIYSGCNVEFGNLSNTIHAEGSALSKMVSDGQKRPLKIAVYTKDSPPAFPCGMCLQSLFEFGGYDLTVIACNDNEFITRNITELLPFGFSLNKN